MSPNFEFISPVRCLGINILGLVLLVSPTAALSQEGISKNPTLESYSQYLDSLGNIQLSLDYESWDKKKPESKSKYQQDWRIIKDKNALLKLTTVPGRPDYSETIINGNRILNIDADSSTDQAKRITSQLNPTKGAWERAAAYGYVCYVFGYLKSGNEYLKIVDLLKNPTESVEDEFSVLHTTCEDYELKVWVSPSKNGMVEKMEYRSLPTRSKDDRTGLPVFCSFQVKDSHEFGKVWVPTKIHCVAEFPMRIQKLPTNVRMINGKMVVVNPGDDKGDSEIQIAPLKEICELTLSNIDVGNLSNADLDPRSIIPNGTKVSMQDARHLDYEWRDGKVVALTDPALAALNDSTFQKSNSRSTLIWSLAALLLVVILGVVYLNRK